MNMKTQQPMPIWMMAAVSAALSPIILGLCLTAFQAWAERGELDTGPRAIPYNGFLSNNGEPYTGSADLRFTLTGEGAPEGCTWMEEHPSTEVLGGRFSVALGTMTNDLPACLFDAERAYLNLEVRGAGAGEYAALAGRQRIHPAMFTYWASEGSDMKIDGNLQVLGDHAAIGAAPALDNPTGAPRLELASNPAAAGAVDEMGDYQLLTRRGSSPQTSVGLGYMEGEGLFHNSSSGYTFYSNGQSLLSLQAIGSSMASALDVQGALESGGLTVDGASSLNGTLQAGTANFPQGLTVQGTLTVEGTLLTVDPTYYSASGFGSNRAMVPDNGQSMCFIETSSGGCQIIRSGGRWRLLGGFGICSAKCITW